MMINGKLSVDEFKMIDRIYIKQMIAERYSDNVKKTVQMSVQQLFPDGNYDEIKDFLKNFEMDHKMPKSIHDPFSINSNGLSPG